MKFVFAVTLFSAVFSIPTLEGTIAETLAPAARNLLKDEAIMSNFVRTRAQTVGREAAIEQAQKLNSQTAKEAAKATKQAGVARAKVISLEARLANAEAGRAGCFPFCVVTPAQLKAAQVEEQRAAEAAEKAKKAFDDAQKELKAASDRNNIAYIKQLVEDQAIVPGDVKMNPQVKDKAFAKVIAQVRKDAEKEAASMSRPFLKATREEGPKKDVLMKAAAAFLERQTEATKRAFKLAEAHNLKAEAAADIAKKNWEDAALQFKAAQNPSLREFFSQIWTPRQAPAVPSTSQPLSQVGASLEINNK